MIRDLQLQIMISINYMTKTYTIKILLYDLANRPTYEKLIKRKGMIGKVIGIAPMVCLFVGYLIIPLVFIGFTSMSSSFSNMSSGKI